MLLKAAGSGVGCCFGSSKRPSRPRDPSCSFKAGGVTDIEGVLDCGGRLVEALAENDSGGVANGAGEAKIEGCAGLLDCFTPLVGA